MSEIIPRRNEFNLKGIGVNSILANAAQSASFKLIKHTNLARESLFFDRKHLNKFQGVPVLRKNICNSFSKVFPNLIINEITQAQRLLTGLLIFHIRLMITVFQPDIQIYPELPNIISMKIGYQAVQLKQTEVGNQTKPQQLYLLQVGFMTRDSYTAMQKYLEPIISIKFQWTYLFHNSHMLKQLPNRTVDLIIVVNKIL